MKANKTAKRKKSIFLIGGGILFLLIALLGGITLFYSDPDYKTVKRKQKMQKTEAEQKDKVIGWIRVEGTNIDLPVIYLEKDTNVSKANYDFAWSAPKTETLQNRAIFVSHNILNVSPNPLIESDRFSRFEALPAFLYPEFARKNQFIQYTVDGKDYIYQIFSVAIVKDDTISYEQDHFSKEELKKYVATAEEESYYKYDLEVNENDSILTLVTCTRFFGPTSSYMIKIEARKLRDFERVKTVKLKVKASYDEIEKKMKEGDSDAEA